VQRNEEIFLVFKKNQSHFRNVDYLLILLGQEGRYIPRWF